MDFYYVSDDYIRFLKQVDKRVPDNDNGTRPYIGVVVEIAGVEYYAPLTSPKPKHQGMRNGKDFRRISGGKYGAINFNNMIPVPRDALTRIIIDDVEDQAYRRLLRNQYTYIQSDAAQIVKTAERLRALVMTDDGQLNTYDKVIKKRCCDFMALERALADYPGCHGDGFTDTFVQ